MNEIAKILIVVGGLIMLSGIFLFCFQRIPGFRRLPGDILVKGKNVSVYFPVITCLLISLVLSLTFNFWNR